MKKELDLRSLISTKSTDIGPNFLCYMPSRESKIYVIDGYLSAAQLIVSQIPSKPSATEDALFYPFLNLLINPIEISLKALIEFTEKHRITAKGHCIGFQILPKEARQAIGSHDIEKLASIVETIMQNADESHRFHEIENTLDIFKKLYQVGITSESTRFTRDKKNRKQPLYEKHTYICPERLYKEVHERCHKIINFMEKEHFYLCEVGEYSSRREKEIASAIYFLKKYESIFSLLKIGNRPIEVKGNKNAKKDLENLDTKILAYLEMGIYFTQPPASVPDLTFFEGQTRSDLIKGVVKRSHLYLKAIKGLERHLHEIQSIRKVKRKERK